jgi:hypothetical protein
MFPKILDRVDRVDPKKISAVGCDGGSNVHSAKKAIHALFCWILNIYDPCHNVNLFMKDIGRLFQKESSGLHCIGTGFITALCGTTGAVSFFFFFCFRKFSLEQLP